MQSDRLRWRPTEMQSLLAALIALTVFLSVTVVPGIFIVDENNYLINIVALRSGHVTDTNTAGLPPSNELLFFDPGPWGRTVNATPVASVAPPLYAPIALPLSFLGWRGLVALNTLAFAATAWLVFFCTRRYSSRPQSAWLAGIAFVLGAFNLEYAQGLWPQCLSVFLCTAGVIAVLRRIDGGPSVLAGAAGFLLAIATGIRYQNAVILAVAGAALFLWDTRRLRSTAAFGLAALVPLSVSSLFNHARFGFWNPISKGPGYLTKPLTRDLTTILHDTVVMFWARVVDYTVRPPLTGPHYDSWLHNDPVTGAHLIWGAFLKKALIQSSPWIAISLIAFVLAWLSPRQLFTGSRRPLRIFSLVTAAVLMAFAVAGPGRTDGFAFNERYLLELVPLAAMALAWGTDALDLRWRSIGAGLAVGIVTVIAILTTMSPASATERVGVPTQLLLMKLPLAIAGLSVVVWLIGLRNESRAHGLLSLSLGVCIGWALMLHVTQDLVPSRLYRRIHQQTTETLERVLPQQSAIVTYWSDKDPAGALMLRRDVVVLDLHADEGRDAPMLIDSLLQHGRRVFLVEQAMPDDVRARAVSKVSVVPVPAGDLPLLELVRPQQR